MDENPSRFQRGFSRDVDAVLAAVELGARLGAVFLYPHEVRENLRMAGMRLDGKIKLQGITDPWQDIVNDEDYEPEFGPEPVYDEEDDAGV